MQNRDIGGVIKDPNRWNAAAALLRGLLMSIPMYPHEKHVEQYQSVLDEFQASCNRDFSGFKIPDDAFYPDSYEPPLHFFDPPGAHHRYCDKHIFCSKLFALGNFVADQVKQAKPPQPTKMPDPPADPKELASQIFIREMHGSQIVQHSPNTSIQNTLEPKSLEFRQLVQAIKEAIPKLQLPPERTNQLYADIGTVEVQINAPNPKHSVIAESMRSIRNILEGAIGSAIASGLLPALIKYFP